jgi:hypothetical protein
MTTPDDELTFLLADRQRTHGRFTDVSTCSQRFKEIARTCPSWASMTLPMREAIDMVLHKLCRALSGDSRHRDHWDDVVGYILRVTETLPKDPPPDSLTAIIERQRTFSLQAFGEGARTKGILDHIARESKEVAASPHDLSEWADLIILAIDGAWRSGATPAEVAAAIVAKQTINANRKWPAGSEDEAILHIVESPR